MAHLDLTLWWGNYQLSWLGLVRRSENGANQHSYPTYHLPHGSDSFFENVKHCSGKAAL